MGGTGPLTTEGAGQGHPLSREGFCPVAFALPRQSHLHPRGICVFFYLVCLLKHCYKGRVALPKRINFCSKGGWGWCVYSSSTWNLFERCSSIECSLFWTGGQLMREERLISGLVTKHLVVDQIWFKESMVFDLLTKILGVSRRRNATGQSRLSVACTLCHLQYSKV